ncbi:MAG: PAS domain-containing sensor histidine kinase, partial [Planctomycetaceae bacterium]
DASPALAERPLIDVNNQRYFAAAYRRQGDNETLAVLYSEEQLRTARRAAAFPPLAVGGVTLVALVIVSAWLASRFGRRIRNVQEQVAHIADGDFREMQPGRTRDEIFELVNSINRMSGKLRELEETIRQTERARLLGQLAGGLAHQLRNAITGTRLAVQIHQRRCDGEPDESLDVALQELAVTEEHVKRLLSVGKRDAHAVRKCRLEEVITDVAALVSPNCRHADVTFRVRHHDTADAVVSDADAVQTAVMNLVLNAAEATGPNGNVELDCRRTDDGVSLEVSDDGPGPPAELRERLFEAFVTGKPEGVGLGLSLVKQVAEQLGGSVEWERRNEQTVFRLTIPTIQQTRSETLFRNALSRSSASSLVGWVSPTTDDH